MLSIKTSASTSNLGPGFDCLGMALDLFNHFEVELSDHDELINVEAQYNNPDNLFLKAYHKAMELIGKDDHVRVCFDCEVPTSRGLGSSSTLIVGGITAASALHDNALSRDQIFQLASKMEGHPDNASPCVFGGFQASMKREDGTFIHHSLSIHPEFVLTVFIPDFEVETAKARAILPDSYTRQIAAANGAKAILTVKAMENGDLDLLKEAAKDEIHEPYRKTLIHEFAEVEKIFKENTNGVLLISGSGSTLLGISLNTFTAYDKIEDLKHKWQAKQVGVHHKGVEVYEI